MEQPEDRPLRERSDRGYIENNQRFESVEVSLDDPQGNNRSLNISATQGRFPFEIWHLITMHAATSANEGYGDSSKYVSNKVKMSSLWNLASASKINRKLVLYCWASTVHLLNQADPKEISDLGTANETNLLWRVRRLVCESQFQIYRAPKNAFEGFKFVEELVLSCHSDINFGEEIQQQNLHGHAEPQMARMSYRRLRVKLPDTLHTLRVYDSHVPDIYFIQQVVEQCPLLQSLTLARCTIFTRQECEFWKRLPRTETDAYFSNQGIPAYAAAIAKELKQIQNLKELNIGIYLTNHGAIDAHISQHSNLGSSPNAGMGMWEKSCDACNTQYREATLASESEATEILGRQVPTLSSVSWASFCSTNRTGWSTHQIMRDNEGTFKGLMNVTSDSGKHMVNPRM